MAKPKKNVDRARQTEAVATESGFPDSASDEFAYLVATHAWTRGLTANAIVRELGMEALPKNIMQVKRALKRAQGRFLIIKPLISKELAQALNEQFGKRIEFHVVNDEHGPSGPIFARAAELIGHLVTKLVGSTKDQERMYVCNAGGRNLFETVCALQRNPPIIDSRVADRIEFVAANAVYQPDSFDRSANYLAVAMANACGANHYAIPIADQLSADEHRRKVSEATLFVCSAGTCKTASRGLMAECFDKQKLEIPTDAVGDIAFNFLTRQGGQAQLTDNASQDYVGRINPSVDLTVLKDFATGGRDNRKRLLVILNADDPADKVEIGTAILLGGYASDVVLGSRLAKLLL